MNNYQITIGYKAVITIDVRAENEKDAKELGMAYLDKMKNRAYKGNVFLQDDNYKVDGILNIDETWNMLTS